MLDSRVNEKKQCCTKIVCALILVGIVAAIGFGGAIGLLLDHPTGIQKLETMLVRTPKHIDEGAKNFWLNMKPMSVSLFQRYWDELG